MSFNGKASGENTLKATIGVYNTINGKSAYEIAVINGFNGSEEDWLESLKGYALTSQDKQDIAELTIEDVIKIKDDYEAGLNDAKSKFESSLKNAINNEKAERQDEIAVERKRIDTLVAAPTLGSTDTELYDARVDFTGYRWQSAGHAMREGDAKLKRKIESIEGFVQPLPVENTLNRSYLNNGVWEVEEDTDYATIVYDLTPYAGRKIRCTVDGANMSAYDTRISYALYDSFGNIIQSGNPTEDAMGFVGYDFWLDIPFNADRVPVTRTGNFILCIPIDYGSGVNFFLEPLFELAKSVSRLRKLVPNVDEILIVGSTNPITSNAVAEAIDGVRGEIPTVDEVVTYGSKNPVSGDAVYNHVSSSMSSAQSNAIQASRTYVDDRIGDIDFSELQGQIDSFGFVDINNLDRKIGWIGNDGKLSGLTNYEYVLIPVKPNEVVELEVNYLSNKETTLACLTSSELVGSSMPAYSEYEGFTGKVKVRAINTNQTVRETYTMPPDAKYLWLCTLEAGNNRIPDVLTINGYDILRSAKENLANKVNSTELANVEKAIADIKNDIDGVAIKRISEMPEINASLSNKTPATWNNVGTTGYHCVMLPVSGAKKLCVNKNDAAEAIVAFLADYPENIVAGGEVHFADVDTTKHKRYQVKGYTEFDIPDGTKYIFVGTEFGSVDCTPSLFEVDGYDYVIGTIDNIKDVLNSVAEVKEDVDKLANIIEPNVRWCAMGDSITQGIISDKTMTSSGMSYTDVENAWVSKMAKRKNWEVTNKGIGGTGFISRGPNNGTKDSAWMVAEKVANEIEGGKGFEQFDIVTIAYGVNDWKQRKTLGEFNDAFETPTTAYGGMRKTIETIIASNPYCKIYMITPINCLSCGGTEATNWGIDKTNDDANYPDLKVYSLGDMFEAIKEVCEYYGIEMIDMTHSSIVNRKNIEVCLEDGVHPNLATHAAMARELGAKINFS